MSILVNLKRSEVVKFDVHDNVITRSIVMFQESDAMTGVKSKEGHLLLKRGAF